MSLGGLEKELHFANKSLYERKGNELNIRSDRVVTIAEYFGVTTDWLLTGKTPSLSDEEEQVLYLYRSLNYRKCLLGHTHGNVTDDYYTKAFVEDLKEQIELVDFCNKRLKSL